MVRRWLTYAVVQIYTRLHDRFASHATQSLDYRIYNLKQLAYLIKDNESRIHAAGKKDLDWGGAAMTMGEVSRSVALRQCDGLAE